MDARMAHGDYFVGHVGEDRKVVPIESMSGCSGAEDAQKALDRSYAFRARDGYKVYRVTRFEVEEVQPEPNKS